MKVNEVRALEELDPVDGGMKSLRRPILPSQSLRRRQSLQEKTMKIETKFLPIEVKADNESGEIEAMALSSTMSTTTEM
jgi:hypothetical protein